jgi:Lar family restriction alleviation protein
MANLKPCPFCGGEAHKRVEFPCDEDGLEMNLYIVGCENCDIEFSFLWNEEYAIEAWNTRKPMETVVAELEERKGTYFDGLPCEGTMIKINEAISIVRGKE